MVDASFALPRHPLGIKPAGNAWAGARHIQRPLQPLTDEILVTILELLDIRSLLAIGSTCRAFYAFSRFDDLWRTRSIE
jgi:F-box-like